MTDMVDGLILGGGLGLTGNVNKLKVCRDSPGESSGEQLRSLLSVQSVQLNAAAGCRREKDETDPVWRWKG